MRYVFNSTKKFIVGEQWDKNSSKDILKYAVGALLYTPATHDSIAEDICSMRHKDLKSIALCLEDAINDDSVLFAEEQLYNVLRKIYSRVFEGILQIECIPLIFIRIRNSMQLKRVFEKVKDFSEIITGFILPKFDSTNIDSYIQELNAINSRIKSGTIYAMPIIESACIASLETRKESLAEIRNSATDISSIILNIRVGGNDLLNQFGYRRNINNTIYDIGVMNNILSDIINVFGKEYIVSAPVWEYFGNHGIEDWSKGLKNEIALDKLNGFTGKTAIHPSQILTIQEAMAVEYADYEDAKKILNWDNEILGVQNSVFRNRMNEEKVHKKWAERILAIAEVYGVKANGKCCQGLV
jgi:citrate lyase beta subunit